MIHDDRNGRTGFASFITRQDKTKGCLATTERSNEKAKQFFRLDSNFLTWPMTHLS